MSVGVAVPSKDIVWEKGFVAMDERHLAHDHPSCSSVALRYGLPLPLAHEGLRDGGDVLRKLRDVDHSPSLFLRNFARISQSSSP